MSLIASPTLRLALPKGRLLSPIHDWLVKAGYQVQFDDRRLQVKDSVGEIEFLLVKNVDLPTYVHHGIAGLGVCGEDLLYEVPYPFFRLMTLPFGSTRLCLAAQDNISYQQEWEKSKSESSDDQYLEKNRYPLRNLAQYNDSFKVATKFTRFTRDYFYAKNIPVEIIALNGSVELAVLCGLAPYIVDLVESGETLRANSLTILEELKTISVSLIANPAYFKYNYSTIQKFVHRLQNGTKSTEK